MRNKTPIKGHKTKYHTSENLSKAISLLRRSFSSILSVSHFIKDNLEK